MIRQRRSVRNRNSGDPIRIRVSLFDAQLFGVKRLTLVTLVLYQSRLTIYLYYIGMARSFIVVDTRDLVTKDATPRRLPFRHTIEYIPIEFRSNNRINHNFESISFIDVYASIRM